VRTTLIVIDLPGLDQPFGLVDRSEPMDVQAFIVQRSVEGFDEGVIGWFAGPGEVYAGSMVVSPKIYKLTSKLCTIIGEQVFWRSSKSNEPV